jgi:hypothetical protein
MSCRDDDGVGTEADESGELPVRNGGPLIRLRVGRDGRSYHGEVRRDWDSPSAAVVEMVTSVRDVPTASLPPLYDVVDPEALDALCSPRGPVDRTVSVTFGYAGFAVAVHADGRVELASR